MARESLGYQPIAYLTIGNTVVQVVSQGCAIAQESLERDGMAKMLAFLKKHWPKVTPAEFVVEGDVGTFYTIEAEGN